jgi:hypothetical protein
LIDKFKTNEPNVLKFGQCLVLNPIKYSNKETRMFNSFILSYVQLCAKCPETGVPNYYADQEKGSSQFYISTNNHKYINFQ